VEKIDAREQDAAHGLSLWLCPAGAVQARLDGLIQSLAARLGTPAFPPHVTLVGGSSVPEATARDACADLAGQISPLRIRSAGLSESERFFRAVVIELDGSPELESARQAAVSALAAVPSPLRPHLSLVYGRLARQDRRAVVQSLAALRDLVGLEVEVVDLELVLTEGPPAAWQGLARVPLAGRAPSSRRGRPQGRDSS
jgi:2'-5' RNA ligase